MTKKPSAKYRNVKTRGFDSMREANRYDELRLLEKAGQITGLVAKPKPYELIPKQQGERAVKYAPDFEYFENGKKVVEDSKGMRTRDYIIKRKIMLFSYGIRIRET